MVRPRLRLVMATTNKELGHKGISTILVEKGTPGFDHGVKEDKLGIRSSEYLLAYFSEL